MISTKKIIKVISNNILDFRTIAKKMSIPYYKNKDLSFFLNNLLKKGIIVSTIDKKYFLPKIEKIIIGIIQVNSKGFGFINDEENLIFIPSFNINGAFNKDEVKVKVFKNPILTSQYQGIVEKIINRNTQKFVGTIKKINGKFSIVPFNKNIIGMFRFKNETSLKNNDRVKVKIMNYGKPIILKVIKNFKKLNNVDMNTLLTIEDSNILYKFNSKIKMEADKISQKINKSDEINRKDLRNRLIITIDGDDTKDFDDAIEIQKIKNNNFKLFIHIADVANYVKEGSIIDKEASLRATSVYLPNYVIPMLPKSLSNGICSLIPKKDRLTITLEIEINKFGKTINYDIYPSIINSKYRLTYKQVNNYYKKQYSLNDKNLEKMLNNAINLSKIIRKYKLKNGYIDFQIEESKIILDKNGKTKKIMVRDRYESEMMIEDFMVRANVTVAKFIEKNKLPFIYRVHDKPNLEKIQNLKNIMKTLGININIKNNYSPLEFTKIIKQIRLSRFDNFIKIIMLKTMSKAIYSPNNIGHFGLALKTYTHFTSPIRRYPDLIVHRLLHEYFFNKNKDALDHFKKILPSISRHSSDAEQKAIELERKVIDIKKAEFYELMIGKSFYGIIVSIMKFGFFVEFQDKVNGLVHVSSLNGKYELLENGLILTNGHNKFTIGDKVHTKIVSVLKSEGKINLEILK